MIAAHPHGCALTAARLLSISTVTGLSIAVLVYAAASFSGDPQCIMGSPHDRHICAQLSMCLFDAVLLVLDAPLTQR